MVENIDAAAEIGQALGHRYTGRGLTHDMLAKQAPKRVGLVFQTTKIVSWDHRKLNGIY